MKRKVVLSNDDCDRILSRIDYDTKRQALTALPNIEELAGYSDANQFRDVLPLIAKHLGFRDYTRLRSCCKMAQQKLPKRYPLFDKLTRQLTFNHIANMETLTFKQHFADALRYFIARVKLEMNLNLEFRFSYFNRQLFNSSKRTAHYFLLSGVYVHYPTGFILKSTGKIASTKNARGHIFEDVPVHMILTQWKTAVYLSKELPNERKKQVHQFNETFKRYRQMHH